MKNNILLLFFCLFSSTLVLGQDVEKLLEIPKKDPFKVNGTVSTRASYAHASGIDDRTAPYFYSVGLRLNFSIYGINIPVYTSIRDNSFHYGTTLPRLKISPSYKWASLQIGDIYTRFNPYVLSQRNMRGVALKLTPGKFRFQALYGSMQDFNSFQDTLFLGTVENNVYSQKVVGGSIGFGRLTNHVDLYVLKSWDNRDSTYYADRNIRPRSNFLAGSKIKLKLFKKLGFTSNTGVSVRTEDTYGLGEETRVGENGLTGDLITTNATTGLSYAGDVALNYRIGVVGLNAKVQYVQPHYKPLTVAFIATDVLNYTLGTSFNTFRKRLFFNGSVGIQRNNISNLNPNSTKRIILNAVTRFQFNKALSANFNYSNFALDYQARLININQLYTYAINNINQSARLNYRTTGSFLEIRTGVSGGINKFQTVVEEDENGSRDYSSKYVQYNINFRFPQRLLEVGFTTDFKTYDNINNASKNYGLGLTLQKGFLEDKLKFNLRNSYTLIDRLEKREGTNLLTTLNCNYKNDKGTSYFFILNRIQRASEVSSDFTEYRTQLAIAQKF